MDQYMDIISAPDAWLIAEDTSEDDDDAVVDRELKPTNSARRVKALVEQVTGESSLRTLSHVAHSSRTATCDKIVTRLCPSSSSAHASSSLCSCRCWSSTMLGSRRRWMLSRHCRRRSCVRCPVPSPMLDGQIPEG